MSCCPGIRCKNTGSGYVKPDGTDAKELDARMKEMLEARRTMDERIWNRVDAKVQPEQRVPTTVPHASQRVKEMRQ